MPKLEKLRAEAMAKRTLAENARRLSTLIHQPELKRDMATHAYALEQLAQELEELVRQHYARDGRGALPAFAGARPH